MHIVRPAREDEVQRLAEIGLVAWEQAIAGFADADAMRRVAQLAFLSFLGDGWARTLVVEAGGASVGWAARENGDGEITDLWIAPSHQRQGLGSALLAGLEAIIARGDFDAVTAKTHADNAPAIAFFRKHGYRLAWFSTAYAARLDRDIAQVGLAKSLVAEPDQGYGGFL